MDQEKEEFLREFGDDYGYPNGPKTIQQIRDSEFNRLDGLVYLDHAGATLYSESQMEAIFKDFSSNVYGNPHGQSDSSSTTTDVIRAARQMVLDYCNAPAKDYKCIFTSGATAALKLVGECFPWNKESCFMYTMENHNSVLGIREYALSQGAAAVAVDIEELEDVNVGMNSDQSSYKIRQHPEQRRATSVECSNSNPSDTICNLFAFPSECNFSGSRFNLNLVKYIKEDPEMILEGSPYLRGRWMALIDAAKGCGTQPPNLAHFQADFVALSFYKIFGYPTGLGALVIRTEAAEFLKKKYFSGGTVASSIADIDFVKKRKGVEEWFEDGTQSFLSIASIHHGFKIINSLSILAIERHTTSLSTYVRKVLLGLRHDNGSHVCILYGRTSSKVSSFSMGPTIAFNLKRPDGSWVGHKEVEKLASLSGIQLRTGCFCNPGACAQYLGLSHFDLLSNIEAGHVCWDDYDILEGKPTGAVRISFGYMSTFEDVKKFIYFIRGRFVSSASLKEGCLFPAGIEGHVLVDSSHLEAIIVYPIKSCAGFSVDSWPLSRNGMLHDREWMLRTTSGDILTQKKAPEMSLISTSIDLIRRTLFVESPLCAEPLQIPLDESLSSYLKEEVEIYNHRYEVQGYDEKVNHWFIKAVARPCTLLRCLSSSSRSCSNHGGGMMMCRDERSKLNFVNEGQLLLISEGSVADLNSKLGSNKEGRNKLEETVGISPMRFRPNLIISGTHPYVEDSWKNLTIGDELFTSLGGCNRCQMINIDFQSGELRKTKEPLATLASYRRLQGKILFGILLKYERNMTMGKGQDEYVNPRLQVGQRVHPNVG